jgi:uncharacterized protein (TIGR03083 family)
VCPGWRVHDVVAHVAQVHLSKLSRARDGLQPAPPLAGESLPVLIARLNQEFVDVAAAWSPRVLIDLLGHLGPQLDAFLASLDLGDLGPVVSWAAPGVPAPVWLDVAREYTELWAHQQQVRDATGRPGANGAQLTTPVTDTFLRAVPYALRSLSPSPGTCVAISVTGAGAGTWSACRLADHWAIGRGAPAGAAATVELSSDCLWRVATGGITVEAAAEQAVISGDQALGSAVLGLVSIIR